MTLACFLERNLYTHLLLGIPSTILIFFGFSLQTKCEQYWPNKVEEPVYQGSLSISMRSESVVSDYIIRVFEVASVSN